MNDNVTQTQKMKDLYYKEYDINLKWEERKVAVEEFREQREALASSI